MGESGRGQQYTSATGVLLDATTARWYSFRSEAHLTTVALRNPILTTIERTPRGDIRTMGRGDKRTRRSKIWRGTNGKTRPRPSKIRQRKRQEEQQSQ